MHAAKWQQATAASCTTPTLPHVPLHRYRKRHRCVGEQVLKRWAYQILEGLAYLHAHIPAIIHRCAWEGAGLRVWQQGTGQRSTQRIKSAQGAAACLKHGIDWHPNVHPIACLQGPQM